MKNDKPRNDKRISGSSKGNDKQKSGSNKGRADRINVGALSSVISFCNSKRFMAVLLSFVMVASIAIVGPLFSFAATSALPPAITKQPIGSATYAKSANMRVYLNASSVDNGYLTYQWYKSDLIIAGNAKDGSMLTQAEMDTIKGAPSSGEVSGAKSAIFDKLSENTPGYYYYWVEITNHLDVNDDGDTDDAYETASVTSAFQLVKVVDRSLEFKLMNGDFQTFNRSGWISAWNNPDYTVSPNNWNCVIVDVPPASTIIPYWNTTCDAGGNPFDRGKRIEIQVPGVGGGALAGGLSTLGHAETADSVILDISKSWAAATPLIVELSASAKSSIYQEVATEPGKIYDWSLEFAAPSTNVITEMVAVVIGPAINEKTDYVGITPNKWIDSAPFTVGNQGSLVSINPGTYQWEYPYGKNIDTFFQNIVNAAGVPANGGSNDAERYSNNGKVYAVPYNGSTYYVKLISDVGYNAEWTSGSGYYTVPAGQGTTVFGFVSIYALAANGGNYLDNILFQSGASITTSSKMTYSGEASLSVDTEAGYAYALAEVRGSTVTNLTGLVPTYTSGGASALSPATAGLGTADWYAGYSAYDMNAGTGTGTGLADGGKLTFTGLIPSKTYRIIGIPIGAINPGLGTNMSAAEVLDDGYYEETLLDPVYTGEDDIRPANVKMELYKSGPDDLMRAIVERSDARVEYAIIESDVGSDGKSKPDPANVASGWQAGNGGNLNFSNLDPDKVYYLVVRPRGEIENTYAQTASRYALEIGTQSQGDVDIRKEDVSREAGATDTIRVAATDADHTYYALDVVTNTYISPMSGIKGNGGEIVFTGLDPAGTYQIMKKKNSDPSLVMLRGVRVYPYAQPLYIDYVNEKIINTSGTVPTATEYAVNAVTGSTGTWLSGDAAAYVSGKGSTGIDLSEPADGSTVSILDSIPVGTAGEMTYRVRAGADGYNGASVSPETLLAIPARPAAPVATVLSPLGLMQDYKIDYKGELIHAGGGDIQISLKDSRRWTDISASGYAGFAAALWDGMTDEDIELRFKAEASFPTLESANGRFASFIAGDNIVKRPPSPPLVPSYDDAKKEMTITGFIPGIEYETLSGGVWVSVPGTSGGSKTWSYDADDISAADIAIRLAATDTEPYSHTAKFSAPITIEPVIMADLDYGYGSSDITAYTITIKNIATADVTDLTLTVDGGGIFEIDPLPPAAVTVPGNGGTNTSYSIKPVTGLNAGTYKATLSGTYTLSGGSTKTATAEVIFKVNKIHWDISKMLGTSLGTEDTLPLEMTGAPQSAKLDYRLGTDSWIIGPNNAVTSSGNDSYTYSSLSPETAYTLSVRAAEDINHYESGVYKTTGYTAYATPIWDEVLQINYYTEVISFKPGYDPNDYIVMIGSDVITDMDSLTAYADKNGTFDISIQHKAGPPETPYPASGVAVKPIAGRDAAPLLSDINIIPASSPLASDGVIEYTVGGNPAFFDYRAHMETNTPSGYQVASGQTQVSPERYDIRKPATPTSFGSHPLPITVAGSLYSVLLHTKTATPSPSGSILPKDMSGMSGPGWLPVTGSEGDYDHDYLITNTPLTLPSSVTSTDYIFRGWYDSDVFAGSSRLATHDDSSSMRSREYWAKWAIKPDLSSIWGETVTGTTPAGSTGLTEDTAITGSVTLPYTVTKVEGKDVIASDSGTIVVFKDDDFTVTDSVTFSPGDTNHVYIRVPSSEDPTAYVYYDIIVTTLPADATKPTISNPSGYTKYVDQAATALSVSASGGNGTLTYQWYVNTADAAMVDDAHKIPGPGATSANYMPTDKAVGTKYYYAVVTNTVTGAAVPVTSSDPSATAAVTWLNRPGNATAPTITTNPMGYTKYVDETADLLIAAASGGTGTLTYQWYVNTTNTAVVDAAHRIAGATSSSYMPTDRTVGTKYYYVVATNTVTNALTETASSPPSVIAIVTWKNRPPNALPPTVIKNPDGYTKYVDETAAALTVNANSLDGGTLSYQWYYNTTSSTAVAGATPVGTDSSAFTPTDKTAGTKYYFVVVTNTITGDALIKTAESTSAAAIVTWLNRPADAAAPTIVTHPIGADYLTTETSPAAMTVSATSNDTGTLSYQWYYNTTDSNDKDSLTAVLIPGATATSRTPEITAAASIRYYFCVVTSTVNNALKPTAHIASNTARISVAVPQYTVNFDISPGTGTAPGQVKGDIFTSTPLPNGAGFSVPNHTFGGWSKTSNPTPSDTDYPVGTAYTSNTDNTITLYAVWVENVALLFDSEGGTPISPVHMDPADKSYGDVNGWPAKDPTRTGYLFTGWYYEEKDGGAGPGTRVDAKTAIDTSAVQSISLHAHWTVDKTELESELSKVGPKMPDVHEENYEKDIYQNLVDAYDKAKAVYDDPASTPEQVDEAADLLKDACSALRHDHPLLEHSHDANYGGVYHLTKYDETVVMKIKGDIRDVIGLTLNGTDYPLTSGGTNIYSITENGTVIGTITEGSAVITFPVAFSDRFANGTHKIELYFSDPWGIGVGYADLIVDRYPAADDSSKGSAILPKTGDDIPLALIIAGGILSLCGLLFFMFAPRRRRKEKKA